MSLRERSIQPIKNLDSTRRRFANKLHAQETQLIEGVTRTREKMASR